MSYAVTFLFTLFAKQRAILETFKSNMFISLYQYNHFHSQIQDIGLDISSGQYFLRSGDITYNPVRMK